MARQIEYGNQRGVPWGVSESGYNTVDVHLNYQYRAFGVPGLGRSLVTALIERDIIVVQNLVLLYAVIFVLVAAVLAAGWLALYDQTAESEARLICLGVAHGRPALQCPTLRQVAVDRIMGRCLVGDLLERAPARRSGVRRVGPHR